MARTFTRRKGSTGRGRGSPRVPQQRDRRRSPTFRTQVEALRGASRDGRKAMRSSYAGFCIDMFDVYVPLVALAPAIIYFHPADASTTETTLLFWVTFAATLLGRPIGAVVFGHLSDRLGRRRMMLVSVGGFSVMSLLIACLPGFAHWGWAAPAALIVLRFVNGIFLGGEYTSATPLAFEHCPREARGLFGGLLIGAFAVAYIAVSLIVLALLALLPHEGVGSAYVQWGWRIPFLVGGLLGFAFMLYRRRIPESHLWERAVKSRRPVRDVLFGSSRREFWQVFALMSGMWFIGSGVVSAMPSFLLVELELDATTVTWALLLANLAFGLALAVVGVVGQIIGRRRLITYAAGVVITACLPLYVLLASGRVESTPWLVLLVAAVFVTSMSVWGVALPYLNERFPTAVRSSGFGMGYTLAIVAPSFYSVYMLALSSVMPLRYTQVVLVVIGALLLLVAARRGPETVEVDLAAEPRPRSRAGDPVPR